MVCKSAAISFFYFRNQCYYGYLKDMYADEIRNSEPFCHFIEFEKKKTKSSTSFFL